MNASVVIVVAIAGAVTLSAAHENPPSRQPVLTQVVMLGTGTPNADPERSGPAVAIVHGANSYLVDAGPGVVRRASAAARNGIAALEMPNLRTVFITHLHSDHTLGLPDLIYSPWVLERTVPLNVYGPPGTKEMVAHLEAAYAADVRNRIDGLEPANETGYKVNVTEVANGFVYRDSVMTVRAFEVPHGDWEHAYAYRFESADRTILVSGDTRASDSVIAACNECDVLVHEVYSAEGFKARPPEWQRYHSRAHTSTEQLAAIANRAKPKLLVLYHQLYWGADDAALLRELTQFGYTGRVESAKDLGTYR
jgi:ribonuclease BN (tRNA processing enzyme)